LTRRCQTRVLGVEPAGSGTGAEAVVEGRAGAATCAKAAFGGEQGGRRTTGEFYVGFLFRPICVCIWHRQRSSSIFSSNLILNSVKSAPQ